MLTCLEVHNHPKDLYFRVGRSASNPEKWAMELTRGPGHGFKLLISSEPAFTSQENVVNSIRELLLSIQKIAVEELSKPESLFTKICGNISDVKDPNDVLNPALIDRICADLSRQEYAQTWTYGL